jgi:hypothetical protein
MNVFNKVLADELNEILKVKSEISIQQSKYAAYLAADQPFDVLKEIRMEIKCLNDKLEMLERDALNLFN